MKRRLRNLNASACALRRITLVAVQRLIKDLYAELLALGSGSLVAGDNRSDDGIAS